MSWVVKRYRGYVLASTLRPWGSLSVTATWADGRPWSWLIGLAPDPDEPTVRCAAVAVGPIGFSVEYERRAAPATEEADDE